VGSPDVGERDQHRVVMEHVLEPRPGIRSRSSLAIEYALGERPERADDRDEQRS
jgi:hypothetical protein